LRQRRAGCPPRAPSSKRAHYVSHARRPLLLQCPRQSLDDAHRGGRVEEVDRPQLHPAGPGDQELPGGGWARGEGRGQAQPDLPIPYPAATAPRDSANPDFRTTVPEAGQRWIPPTRAGLPGGKVEVEGRRCTVRPVAAYAVAGPPMCG